MAKELFGKLVVVARENNRWDKPLAGAVFNRYLELRVCFEVFEAIHHNYFLRLCSGGVQ